MTLRPLPAALLNVVLIGLALLDAWVHFDADEWLGNVCASIAAFALVLRHRLPLPTLLLALPAVLVADALFAALVALYSLASSTRRHVLLSLGALAVVAGGIAPWPSPRRADLWSAAGLTAAGHALAAVTAAALLGRLVQARRDLSARIAEVSEARDHERLLLSRTVLAKERAQLAGEMHDVVSHQVGLITVRAGALQVGSRDPAVKEAAATIRRLSVQTLDELRYMVGVLRASGSRPTELTPQPSLADLQHLVSGSGVEAELHTDVPDDLPPAVQRAVYRTVQEALVNVRKHAPGATATVRIHHEGGTLHATVTNTAPTRSAPPLPNASYGLVGLRERAEFLGGTVNSGPTAEGGYELRLRLPVSGTSRTSLRSAPPGGGRCDRG
ncbi:sensor histidine kinase [Streptomyces purpurogeneiscleroticus]|uniref:sensor histidine kinase n=1 Tax=Streptomyces purpurogeneiscleroticus TaxID=68259 RepID=UPI001CBE3D55|nr:sensor histidine kinase [Streptomyces purpurogeneiscleroticus]MBZ4018778.1 two-component sensor histidine kinase [Streptomyces purpurogeneiscleroticus]